MPGRPGDASAMVAPATATATNIMPTNNNPLPKNTVAKKRSSRSALPAIQKL